MDIAHYIENGFPKHNPVLHLMDLEHQCSELTVKDYNRVAAKLSGDWQEPCATVATRRRKK